MDDVQIFYSELESASSSIETAVQNLVTENGSVSGEDTGIENPAYRTALRLEMNRRLNALHDRVLLRAEHGSGIGALLRQIASLYADLDVELTGQEQS